MRYPKNNLLFYKLNKEVFFNNIKFRDSNELINAVKTDWSRLNIYLNDKKPDSFHSFLEYITINYSDYLEKILMLCNQNAHFISYNKIFDIISKYDYHFSTTSDDNSEVVRTDFNLSIIIKQGIVTNTYNIFKIEDKVKICKKLKTTTIIDFSTLDPVLVKIEYLD